MLPNHLAGDAELLVPPPAKIALAAGGKIMKANPITPFEVINRRSRLLDDSSHLVAERQRQRTHS
jgi:hypothetical protein